MILIATLLAAALPGPCTATDGDTIRCGQERIRLLGINAPELPGHCRRGRRCAPGNPHASRASLAAALTGPLTIQRTGTDHYGRTLALIRGSQGDLSCWQLHHRAAIYVARWDKGKKVARNCARLKDGVAFHSLKALVVKRPVIFSGIFLGGVTFSINNFFDKLEGNGFRAAAVGKTFDAYRVAHFNILDLPNRSSPLEKSAAMFASRNHNS